MAGHVIHRDRPDAVIAAIEQVVQQVGSTNARRLHPTGHPTAAGPQGNPNGGRWEHCPTGGPSARTAAGTFEAAMHDFSNRLPLAFDHCLLRSSTSARLLPNGCGAKYGAWLLLPAWPRPKFLTTAVPRGAAGIISLPSR